MVICRKHGDRSPGVLVCKHIADDVVGGVSIQPLITVTFRGGFFAGDPDCPMDIPMSYCVKCVDEFDFPAEGRDISEKEFESMAEPYGWFRPVCWRCLEPLLIRE